MNRLTHEQAIRYLHANQGGLSAAEREWLSAHLAVCLECRAYADKLGVLQPALFHALHLRRHPNYHLSVETIRTIQNRRRRSVVHKQALAVMSTVAGIVVLVIIGALFTRYISNQEPSSTQPTATLIATVMPTSTPSGGADRFEPNNDFEHATSINLGIEYDGLNFAESTPNNGSWDSDYFKVRIKPGMSITCRTFNLTPSTDTNIILYDKDHNGISGNDNVNPGTGDKSGSVSYDTIYEGWLYILVGEGVHRSPAEAQRATYSLECFAGTQPSVTQASTPPTISGTDRFEPNNDFDHATSIELGVAYDSLNFVEYAPSNAVWDNDFFKVQVKQRVSITCRTFNLSPGTDTNMILYNNDHNGISGNDDVNRANADLSSSVTYDTTYEGWLYILVGEGFTRSPTEAQRTNYSLECSTTIR